MVSNMRSEIHKSMVEDIRTMKRIGRNIKYQKGKRGLIGVMYDSNKGLSEKKIKSLYDGEVVSYNMEKIMHKDEFKYLNKDVQKLHLEAWRTRYSNSEIAEQMGYGYSTLCAICNRLGITGDGKQRPKIKRKAKDENIVHVEGGKIGIPKPQQPTVKESEEVGKVIELDKGIIDTSHEKLASLVTLNETVKGEKLATRLQAIAMLINDEEEYTIELIIKR